MRRNRREERTPAPQSFDLYCRQVCFLVSSSTDHPLITAELLAHMEDRRDAFLRAGFSEEEAQRRAVAAMGDPAEVGRAMDKAHPMGWDMLLAISRSVLGLALALLLFALISYGGDLYRAGSSSHYADEPEFRHQWTVGQVIPVDEHVTLYLNKATIVGGHDGALRYFLIEWDAYYLFDGKRIRFNQYSNHLSVHDNLGNLRYYDGRFYMLDRNASSVTIDFDNGMRSYHAEVPLDWGDIPNDG